MNNTFCINRKTFLIILFILILTTSIFMYSNPNVLKNKTLLEEIKEKCPKCEECQDCQECKEQNIIIKNTHPKRDYITELDRNHLENPLAPPYRRLPSYDIPRYPLSTIINIPSRGTPDSFQYIGNLIRKSDEKFVQLFGRPSYPGSNKYEYYGIATDPYGLKSKLSIKVKRDQELFDGDEIIIDEYSKKKDKFKLFINEMGMPKYNPYVI